MLKKRGVIRIDDFNYNNKSFGSSLKKLIRDEQEFKKLQTSHIIVWCETPLDHISKSGDILSYNRNEICNFFSFKIENKFWKLNFCLKYDFKRK